MLIHITHFISFSFSTTITFFYLFSVSTQAINLCQTTPHPDHCNHYLTANDRRLPSDKKDFRIMVLESALDRALYARDCAINLDKSVQSKRKKHVSKDCCKLVNNTVTQLNETLTGLKTRKISDFVAQTWLSTALTNLQICLSGSGEMNLTEFVYPIKMSNLTEMISNSLAINYNFFMKETQLDDQSKRFPKWVTKKDRKLMVSETVYSRANVTVSKEKGSMFKTIQSAVDYAASVERGDERFVIYIKRGVYKENIEIGYDMKNIMFLGDGLRYTIITGDRSVAGGFTTYSTATVGMKFLQK